MVKANHKFENDEIKNQILPKCAHQSFSLKKPSIPII